MPGLALERTIFEVFESYVEGLRRLNVPSPLIVLFTLQDVGGAFYYVRRQNFFGEPDVPLPEDVLRLPECVIENYGGVVDYHRAVRPAFDALWNALGYSKAQSFNEEGRWSLPR